MVGVAEPQQGCPEPGVPRQIEWPPPLPRGDPPGLRLALRLGHGPEIHQRQGEGGGRRDHLAKLTVHVGEDRPQDLVAPHHLLETPRQRSHVQGPQQPKDGGLVVRRTPQCQLVGEPERLLGKGRRESAVSRDDRYGQGAPTPVRVRASTPTASATRACHRPPRASVRA